MRKEYILNSPSETKNLAKKLAKESLKKKPKKKGLVFALIGELGSGKTTFLKGFASGLGIKKKILSPTFVIMKRFKINNGFKNFYHIDCYRIEKPEQILKLGFKEIISNPKNIITIEWADYIKEILPKNAITVNFKVLDKNKREVNLDFPEK